MHDGISDGSAIKWMGLHENRGLIHLVLIRRAVRAPTKTLNYAWQLTSSPLTALPSTLYLPGAGTVYDLRVVM